VKRIETLRRYVIGQQAGYSKYSVFWAVTELWACLSRMNAQTRMSNNRWVSGYVGTAVGGDWFSATKRRGIGS
jgi:hypothetical protein